MEALDGVRGGTLRSPVGVLHIDELAVIEPDDITLTDARAAGSARSTPCSLHCSQIDRRLYRVRFHLAGADPRIALRERTDISDVDRSRLDAQLDRWDRASINGP